MRAVAVRSALFAAIVSFAGTSSAVALSFNDIGGRWCSDDGNYRFTRTRLYTTHFATGVSRTLRVYEYFFQADSFRLVWRDERKTPITTHYAGYSGRRMVQLPTVRSGSRELRRC